MIFTELWLDRIKEIYITTYQSDFLDQFRTNQIRLLEKSNFNHRLAITVFSLIKFIGINWREVSDLQKQFEEGNDRDNNFFDLSTAFPSWSFVPFDQFYVFSIGWVQFLTWIHFRDAEFLSRKEQFDVWCVLQDRQIKIEVLYQSKFPPQGHKICCGGQTQDRRRINLSHFCCWFTGGEEMSTSLFCYRSALLFWLTEWSPVSHCGETSAQPLEKVRNRVQPGPVGVQEHRRHHRVSLSVELFLLLWQMVMGGLEDPGEPVKWCMIFHIIYDMNKQKAIPWNLQNNKMI